MVFMSTQSEVESVVQGSSSPPESPGQGRPAKEAGLPTPAELARIAESYDEEDWFEFLDQMDDVYRRRRDRGDEPDPPVDASRETIAEWKAKGHLFVDRTIRQILFLPKDAPPNEIRLIEVNDRLSGPDLGNGPIGTMNFPLGIDGDRFVLSVADVNSDELEAIKAGRLLMPPGWTLDDHKIFHRRYS
jgi:hypothetical protein